MARGFTPYCGSMCRSEEGNLFRALIGGVMLAGATAVACFYGFLLVTILRGEAGEKESIGTCVITLSAALLVAAASIFLTGGSALGGLLFLLLIFGGAALFGKRRRW
jgi:hypothetical protein